MLTIAEELLLLALDNKKGTVSISASDSLKYGLAGGLLVELTLNNRLALHKNKVIVNDSTPLEDKLLNHILQIIINEPKSKSAKYWVNKLDESVGGIKRLLCSRLTKQTIIEKRTSKVLWLFTRDVHPVLDIEAKRNIKLQLRKGILQADEPDERIAVLGSLVYICNMVNDVFPIEERKAAKKILKRLSKNEVYGKAVSETVQAMQSAVIAAATVAAISASTAVNSSN